MKHIVFTLAIAALVLPATALGKGPSAASIDGPGGGGGITFTGNGESGGTRLGDLTLQSGFIPAVFVQQPDPMLETRPNGDLGPKYTITYTVPGPNYDVFTLRQDLYPYAPSGPVTYMEPGQQIFHLETRGGWFQAGPELKKTLVSAGLPARAAAAASDGGTPARTTLVGLPAFGLALGATAVILRRRARPAPAA